MRHPFFALPVPLVIGHRGASGERPENTLPSFAQAVASGAVILETDVHRSRDGVVVLLHDPELERTSDGRGSAVDHSFEELRRLDAGYRFSPDGGRSFPQRGKGIQIPSLDEALEAFPGIRFNIEIKQHDPRLIRGALAAVAEAKAEDRVLLTAAEDRTMGALRAELRHGGPRVAVGASSGDVVAFLRALEAGGPPPEEPMALQIPPEFQGRPLATRPLVDFAHRHGVQVHVWTINDSEAMRRLLELGVDGIMSDFPGRLRDAVARWRDGG